MKVLRVSIGTRKNNEYSNKINSEDYKLLALILRDLENLGCPIEKAYKYLRQLNKTDFEATIGI